MSRIEPASDFAPSPALPKETSVTGSSRPPEVTARNGRGQSRTGRSGLCSAETVHDPEIPVNLVDLGLIYEIAARKDGLVYIEMTLTTPACPVAGWLPGQVQQTAASVRRQHYAREACLVPLLDTRPHDR